jgi:hypothetical protein
LNTNFQAERFHVDPLDFVAMDGTGQIVRTGQGFGREVTGHIQSPCTIQVGWDDVLNTVSNPSRIQLLEMTLTFTPTGGTTAPSPFSTDPGQLSSPNGTNMWLNAGFISATGQSGQPVVMTRSGNPVLGPAVFIQTLLVTEGVWEFSIRLWMTDGSTRVELTHDPEMRVGEDPN